jgi:hypothetical protein
MGSLLSDGYGDVGYYSGMDYSETFARFRWRREPKTNWWLYGLGAFVAMWLVGFAMAGIAGCQVSPPAQSATPTPGLSVGPNGKPVVKPGGGL